MLNGSEAFHAAFLVLALVLFVAGIRKNPAVRTSGARGDSEESSRV